MFIHPLPSHPLDPSSGTPRQSLGGQLRNLEAEPPFQLEPAKTTYPKGVLLIWGHLGAGRLFGDFPEKSEKS